MNIKTLIENLSSILATDSKLITFCTTSLGKQQTVYVGTNPNDPIGQIDLPAIVIDSLVDGYRKGTTRGIRCVIGIILKNETMSSVGTVRTYEGFVKVNELMEQIEQALARNQKQLKANFSIERFESVPNQVFPLFSNSMTVLLEYLIPVNTMRDSV